MREDEIERRKLAEAENLEREAKARKQRVLFDFWNRLSDLEFEHQCAQLFRDLGFKADATPITNDGGIDIVLQKDGKRGAAQCKAWQQPCGVKEVREFCGVISTEKLEYGFFISKSGFTESAATLLKKAAIIQGWDINKLIEHAMKQRL